MKRWLFLALWVLPLFAQSNTGELRLNVTDPAGLGVKSSVEIVSEANHYRQSLLTDDAGNLAIKRLPFDCKVAGVIGQQGLPVMIGFADDLHRALHPQPRWVGHVQTQLPGVALRK